MFILAFKIFSNGFILHQYGLIDKTFLIFNEIDGSISVFNNFIYLFQNRKIFEKKIVTIFYIFIWVLLIKQNKIKN